MRELAEARNQGETLIYSTEKSLKEHRDTLDEETVSTIESRIAELRGVLDGSDAAAIRTKSEELMEASHRLAQAIYERVQAQQSAGAAAGGGGGASGDGASASEDEVVEEADYEVIDEETRQS